MGWVSVVWPGCGSRSGDLVPDGESSGHFGAVVIGREPMAAGPEMREDHAEHRQGPLGCAGGAEAFHGAFAVPGRLVRVPRPVVQVSRVPVLDRRHHRPIASERVGDQHPRYPALLGQQLTEEPLGGLGIPARLDQDVEDVAVLVDGPPQVVTTAVDRQERPGSRGCRAGGAVTNCYSTLLDRTHTNGPERDSLRSVGLCSIVRSASRQACAFFSIDPRTPRTVQRHFCLPEATRGWTLLCFRR